jgi:serine/threonine-protein kinase
VPSESSKDRPKSGGPQKRLRTERGLAVTTPPDEPKPASTTGPADGVSDATPTPVKPKKKKHDEPRIIRTDRQFGRFELLMEMARGGMATLYLARIRGPEQFEKKLVIKRIHEHLAEEEEFIGMFLDEARITALIHHPNVATIFDMGQIQGAYFIAMEYVHGENLTSVLRAAVRQKGGFKWPYAAKLVADAAAGLHAAHELRGPDGKPLGVVHRDVSPQNILLSYDGHVKVVDFGIAYAAERISHTQAGTLKGKVSYMSPEQTGHRDLDRRSDVFSLGIVLFESVCLKRLFKEKNEGAALLRVREADVPKPRSIRKDIPPELERIILKALAKDPEVRYQTAGDLEDDLNRLLINKGQMVGHKQLAKLMETLFYQRRKVKDEQIQRALEGTSDRPVRGVGMAGTSTSLEQPTGASEMTGQGQAQLTTFLKVAIGLGCVLAAAIVVLIVVLVTRGSGDGDEGEPKRERPPVVAAPRPTKPEPRPDARPMKTEPRPRDDKPKTVSLKVVILPKRANPTVRFRDKRHKGSIFQVVVERAEKQEELVVTAPGFKKETIVLVPVEDKEIIMTLTPRRRRPRKPRDELLTLPE